MEQKIEKAGVTALDLQIATAVGICIFTSAVLNNFGIKFNYGGMQLEVIQKMTSAIACLLCCQGNAKTSFKSGVNRLVITAIGGGVGIGVVLADYFVQNQWCNAVFIIVGIVITLFLCKAAKVPFINARIGGVTFILVSCTLSSNTRIWYAVFRLISTIYGVLVVLLVSFLFQYIPGARKGEALPL